MPDKEFRVMAPVTVAVDEMDSTLCSPDCQFYGFPHPRRRFEKARGLPSLVAHKSNGGHRWVNRGREQVAKRTKLCLGSEQR